VKARAPEDPPAGVSRKETKQAGEGFNKGCAEPVVWTERMLTALIKGVKGGKWFSLIDKVYSLRTLRSAFERVEANKGAAGIDHQTIEMFSKRLDANLEKLSEQLEAETYRPRPLRRQWISKLGSREKRPLGIPTVRDRVVQTALRYVLEPIFEIGFATHSYGFRPGRGCKDALRRVDTLLKEKHWYVVDADLKSYFDTIPHKPLMQLLEEKVSDGRVLALIEAFLQQDIMDGLSQWTPEEGAPQGAVMSPLLSNIYLDPLDHLMAERGFEMVRYADDFVILCRTQAEAEQALALVRQWTESAGLQLHPDKTCIAYAPGEGFEFLGYHFHHGKRDVRRKSLAKFKATIRAKTRRCNGESLDDIIRSVNGTSMGWFKYFKHAHRYTFTSLDGWIRMRLRSILRKRRGGRGRGRGADHQRWPNAFFAQHGLLSLAAAHAWACQSARKR
jgi:RNA-directed DNA polymerase